MPEDTSNKIQSLLKIRQFKPGSYSTYQKSKKTLSRWESIEENKQYHLHFVSSHIYKNDILPAEEMIYKQSVWNMLVDESKEKGGGNNR